MKLNLPDYTSGKFTNDSVESKYLNQFPLPPHRTLSSGQFSLRNSVGMILLLVLSCLFTENVNAQTRVIQWNGLNSNSYYAEPTIVLGGLKSWPIRVSTNWLQVAPTSQSGVNFTDNYMDKATTIRGQRNYWAIFNKNVGAGATYNSNNYVEFKVSPTYGTYNVNLVQFSAIWNGVQNDTAGRMAVYYSVDNDTMSFNNPMNLGVASLAMHNGTFMNTSTTIANPAHLQSAANLSQLRNSPHQGDYSFTPNITVNTGQTLTIRVYAWNANNPEKSLLLRNMVISDGTPWPNQELAPTQATNVTPTRATVSSEILTNGGYPVIASGFAHTTLTYYTPGVNDRQGIISVPANWGQFSGTFTGLTPATTYYSRSYVTNENGTSYGKVVMFTTPDSVTAKPTVSTATASNIGAATATSGGNISNNGGGQIVASGVLYSTTLKTTSTLVLGSGATVTTENVTSGNYTSNLTGLLAGTKYYVRAYASNSDSTGYGAIDSFTTKLVDIVTTTPSNISSSKATSGGTITPNGGGTITASGVVVSTVQNPTLTTPGVVTTTENATTGTYTSQISGLSANTTYYVRAYATIGGVTTYGDQKSFTTTSSPVVVQWNGLNGSSYSTAVSRLIGNVSATNFRISNAWADNTTSTSNVNNTDNFMYNAADPKGNRNTWPRIAQTSGIGAAFSDSGFVEFKISPTAGSNLQFTLFQFEAIMNSSANDNAGRLAVYYSVDNNAISFGTPMSMGTGTVNLFKGGTMTTTATSSNPIILENHQDYGSNRQGTFFPQYKFTPNISVNSGQTLTIRIYAWNANIPGKYLNLRNVIVANTSNWPNVNITTNPVTNITPTRALSGGNIMSDGGYPVTESGLVWSKLTYYLVSRNDREGIFTTSPTVTSGSYGAQMTNLTPATTYYARAFVNTENGLQYGQVVSFTTPDSVTAKPTVTTTAATNVMSSTATSGGNISNNGGGQIVASGVLYSTTLNTAATLVLGSGATVTTENVPSGNYTSNLTGLMAGTKYYVRAYASNSDSTGYGAIDSFTTKLVGIVTTTPTNISSTKAVSGGTITPNGGGTITASGVVVSTVQNPTLATPGAIVITGNDTTGTYVSSISGLAPNTTYYVRAYATIGGVTTYADQKSFKTSVAPQVVQWNGLNGSSYYAEPTVVLGGLKAWDQRISNNWLQANPDRQSVNFTDNFMDKATTIRGQRNYWALLNKNVGAGADYSDSNFIEYKVAPVGTTFNVKLVEFSAIWNGSQNDTAGRMAVYYSIDNDTMSFNNPMNLGTASLAMHNGTFTTTSTTIANPVHLQSAANISQLRNSPHAGDYSFTPNLTVNAGQTLTIRVYAWNADKPDKSLAIRNMVITGGTPWPNQELAPTTVTAITPTSAVVGGNILTDGGYPVTAAGAAWTTLTYYAPGVNDRQGSFTTPVTYGPFNGTMTGLTPATTYWVRTYATNQNGTVYGKIISFTTKDSVTARPTITTITATNIGAAAAVSGGTINNNGGGVIIGSGVIYSTSLKTDSTLVLGAGASQTAENATTGSFTSNLTGLLAGTTYYYRAYASNGDSTGYGAIDSFTTKLIDIVTDAATNITATTALTGGTIIPNPINGGTVTVSGVIISTVPNPGIGDVTIITSTTTSGEFDINLTGLSPNTTYYVTAFVTVNGVTVYGQQTSFTTTGTLPVTITTFTGRSASEGVVVNWKTAQEQNLLGYYVERGTGNGNFKEVSGLVRSGLNTYSFTDKNVPAGTYFYRLRIVDLDGTVKYSNVVIVIVNARAGFVLNIYPNPTSRMLNVVHQAANSGTIISVAGSDGKIVMAKTLQTGDTQTVFDVSRLAAGMYFVTVNDNNKKSVIKFIKD